MNNMTDLKLISMDAAVDNIMKGIKHLEVIVEKLNEKVGALEAKETKLEKQIDMLIKELKDTREDSDKLERKCENDVEYFKIVKKNRTDTQRNL